MKITRQGRILRTQGNPPFQKTGPQLRTRTPHPLETRPREYCPSLRHGNSPEQVPPSHGILPHESPGLHQRSRLPSRFQHYPQNRFPDASGASLLALERSFAPRYQTIECAHFQVGDCENLRFRQFRGERR